MSDMRDRAQAEDELDTKFGFARFGVADSRRRLGWLLNMHPTLQTDPESGELRSCMDFFFLQEDGQTFKATLPLEPYFYLSVKANAHREVEDFLRRRYPHIRSIVVCAKEDLDMKNHLSGLTKKYLRLSFRTVQDLVAAKAALHSIVTRNSQKQSGEVDVFRKVREREKRESEREKERKEREKSSKTYPLAFQNLFFI